MKFSVLIVALCMFLTTVLQVNSQSCTVNILSREEIQNVLLAGVTGQHADPMKRNVFGAMKKKEMNGLKETNKQQSLFIHQMFNCTGQLTRWIFAAKWQNNKRSLPELQIWRAVNVGSTVYKKINSTQVNMHSKNNQQIYDFTLPTPIDVMAGDVLSVYQPSKKDSKLVVYFYEGGEEDKYTYYHEKADSSMNSMDTSTHDTRVAKPLVTALISQVFSTSTSSTSTRSSTSAFSSISYLAQFSSSVQVKTVPPLLPTTVTTTQIMSPQTIAISTNGMSSSMGILPITTSLIHSPTTSLITPAAVVHTTTPCLQTCSWEVHHSSESIHLSWLDQTQRLLPSNHGTGESTIISAIPTCQDTSDPCTQSSSLMMSKSTTKLTSTSPDVIRNCHDDKNKTACNIEPLNIPLGRNDDEMPGISNLVIVLVIVFATIFTCGMTFITICVLCVIIILFKRKKYNNEMEMISYTGGSRQNNRYIQKTVTSPMYEGIGADPSSEAEHNQQQQQLPAVPIVPPAPPATLPITEPPPPPSLASSNKTSTLSSVASSCPSVTVQPDVIVNIKHSYDHLTVKRKEESSSNKKPTANTATTTSNPVSPYEKPVIPDELAYSPINIPIGYYELADEIYVPTENQRQMLNDVPNGSDQESLLYKSLYEAQHEAISSDDDDDQNENKLKKQQEFFKETKEYWKPSYTKKAIYQQLANKRFREVPRHKIQVIEYLGSGQFATVNKALWKMAGGNVEVAVKMIKEGAPEEERIKFLREAAINGQFHHLNVVRLLGVVTVGEPTMIILELLRNGNLKKFLTSRRKPIKGETVSPELLLNFSKQVSSGMEYLSKKTFVHRDVAARNILVSDQLICKVADFGMSRDLEESNYYVSQGGLVPIKWTAPEALYYRKYSSASDVWSYGVLLFEIWSFGKKPFSTVTNEQYIDSIDEGKRLAPPPGCPRPIYQMMIDCWHPEASERPTFTEIYQQFDSSNESSLLSLGITDDELVESPQCDTLGAPLDSGSSLFLDLQMKYCDM